MKFYILHATFAYRMYFWLLLPLEADTYVPIVWRFLQLLRVCDWRSRMFFLVYVLRFSCRSYDNVVILLHTLHLLLLLLLLLLLCAACRFWKSYINVSCLSALQDYMDVSLVMLPLSLSACNSLPLL
jgi:hypothetical protein